MARRQLLLKRRPANTGGLYFSSTKTNIDFISSGCAVLDCVLGGGWPLGRVVNIVGDKSTGKTLLAIEAAANCAATFTKGRIWYREAEAAFDRNYAAALGMPLARVSFGDARLRTVEDLFEDLAGAIKSLGVKGPPGLYIVDSLDALSDRAELDRDMGEA